MNTSNLFQENEGKSSAGSSSHQPLWSSHGCDPPKNVNYLAHTSNLNVTKALTLSPLNERLKLTRETPSINKLFENSVQFQLFIQTCNTKSEFLENKINNLKFTVEEVIKEIESMKTSYIGKITKFDETLSRLVTEINEKNESLLKNISGMSNIQEQFPSKLSAIEVSIDTHVADYIKTRECVLNRIRTLEKTLKLMENKFQQSDDTVNDLSNRLVDFEKSVGTQQDSYNLSQKRFEQTVQVLNSRITDLQNQNESIIKELEISNLYEKIFRAHIEQQEELVAKKNAKMSKFEELVEQLLTRMGSMETCFLHHVSDQEKREKARDSIFNDYEAVIADLCSSLDDRVTDLSKNVDGIMMKQDSKDASKDNILIYEEVDESYNDEQVARCEDLDSIFMRSPFSSGESDISKHETQVLGKTLVEKDDSCEETLLPKHSDSIVSLQSHSNFVESSGLFDDKKSDYISTQQNKHAGVPNDSSSEFGSDDLAYVMDMFSFSDDELENTRNRTY